MELDVIKQCAKHVNSQRAIRHRAPLKGEALRRQAVAVYRAVMFEINLRRLQAASHA